MPAIIATASGDKLWEIKLPSSIQTTLADLLAPGALVLVDLPTLHHEHDATDCGDVL